MLRGCRRSRLGVRSVTTLGLDVSGTLARAIRGRSSTGSASSRRRHSLRPRRRRTSDFKFRALSVAGRAAHLASREREALELYRRAEASAPTQVARRDALWGQLICATDLELPEATTLTRALTASVIAFRHSGDPAVGDVRSSATEADLGSLDLTDADAAYGLLSTVDDPLVVSSFQSVYSFALVLALGTSMRSRSSEELLATANRIPLGLRDSIRARLRRLRHAPDCEDGRRLDELAREALDRFRSDARHRWPAALVLRCIRECWFSSAELSTALALEMPSLHVSASCCSRRSAGVPRVGSRIRRAESMKP